MANFVSLSNFFQFALFRTSLFLLVFNYVFQLCNLFLETFHLLIYAFRFMIIFQLGRFHLCYWNCISVTTYKSRDKLMGALLVRFVWYCLETSSTHFLTLNFLFLHFSLLNLIYIMQFLLVNNYLCGKFSFLIKLPFFGLFRSSLFFGCVYSCILIMQPFFLLLFIY